MTSTPPVALTIAGSDSGGGAGIQADLRTFAAFGVHGTTAIAALTAQNTYEIRSIQITDPGFLREQIEAVLDDMPVAAVKTGMLGSAANVRVVAELSRSGRLPNLVVDPVMVSSSGATLLEDDAVIAYREELLPQAVVATPNLREALRLTGSSDYHGALGAAIVLVTGGDGPLVDTVTDALYRRGDQENQLLTGSRIPTGNTHGTGCSLASAITAQFALGTTDPLDAIEAARAFIRAALAGAQDWCLGSGHGPIDHLGFTSNTTSQRGNK